MMRRGFWTLLVLAAGLSVVIWKMNLAEGEAAQPGAKPAASDEVQTGKVSYAAITGFRSAKFGDDEAEVREAIKSDFGKSGDDIRTIESAVARTKSMALRVTDLIPETGEAELGYVLGYKSRDLIQVNILWGTPVTPGTTGVSIAKTALLLRSYFAQQNYDPKTIIHDRKINNGVLAFQARDAQGHLIRLIYREVPIGKPAQKADEKAQGEQKKAYTLILSYVADPKAPDVFKIDKGAF